MEKLSRACSLRRLIRLWLVTLEARRFDSQTSSLDVLARRAESL